VSGTNMQQVKVGGLVLIHNDGPRIRWRCSVVDSLIQGNDGLVHAMQMMLSLTSYILPNRQTVSSGSVIPTR